MGTEGAAPARQGVLIVTAPPGPAAADPEVALAVDRAARWLFGSGIQSAGGGCHAWYDATSGYQALYPEVTGYLVTFAEWPRRRPVHPGAEQAADRAASWLTAQVEPGGGFPCLVPEHDARLGTSSESAAFLRKARRRYTFDAGIVLQGLTAYARRTDANEVRTAALALGRWLVDEQDADGTFTPFTGPEDWSDVAPDWSTRPGCHQAKVAIGLLALAELESDPGLEAAAVRAVRAATGYQRPDGRFVTNTLTDGTNVHPHCYAAEACWAIGTALGDQDLLDAAARATRFLLDHSVPGSVLRTFRPTPDGGSTVTPVRVDGLAQTLRLGVLTGVADERERAALVVGLLGHQERSDDPHADGGFRFGFGSGGAPLAHPNVWVTAFAAQALELAASDGSLDWRHLV